jgi:hypothetical protein
MTVFLLSNITHLLNMKDCCLPGYGADSSNLVPVILDVRIQVCRRLALELVFVWISEKSSILSRERKEICFYQSATSNPPADQREQCNRKVSSCGRRYAEAGGSRSYQSYVQP